MSTSNATPARRTRVEQGIYTRADGKYEIGWWDASGKQRWRKVEGGISAARRARAAEVARRDRGERVAADPRTRFHDAAQGWWDVRVVNLRPATQSIYANSLGHLKRSEQIGRKRLSDITPADVAQYVAAKQAAGLSGWTIRGHLVALSAVFKHAGRHLGYVGTNPVALLDRVERPSIQDEKPKRILSGEELRRLVASVDEPYRLVFEVEAETGARLGEVLGLVWEDVDLANETITFTHQLGRDGKRAPLKTQRSRRCLEVTPNVISALRAAKLASPRSGPRDFVFITRAGTAHDHRNISGRVLSRAVAAAGLEAIKDADGSVIVPAPTFHSLRHSHASALIAQGWDIEEVSSRLGHANVATTQRTYVHQFDAARRSVERRERLSRLYAVEGPVEGTDDSGGQQIDHPVAQQVDELGA